MFSVFTLMQTVRHVTYRSHEYATFIFLTLLSFSHSEPPLALCYHGLGGITLGTIPRAHGEAINDFPSVLGNDCICAES